MSGLGKKVLLTQLSEEEGKLWQTALKSQGIEVFWQPANTDIAQLLEKLVKKGKALPDLLIMDMGIVKPDSTALQAAYVCRWRTESQANLKIVLTNPRQDQVKSVEHRWALRQGALDLLPRLQAETLFTSVQRVTELLEVNFQLQPLEELAKSLAPLEVEVTVAQKTNSKTLSRTIRETATAELIRKMALIPLIVMSPDMEESTDKQITSTVSNPDVSLGTTLAELNLHDFQIDLETLGNDVAKTFKDNHLLPGVILTDKGEFAGMISRRRFLEFLSRPYGLEIFSKRPMRVMFESAAMEPLLLSGNISAVMAAQQCLQRTSEAIYEPVVVHLESGSYRLLDVYDLFLAQSQIHEVATKLLREQTQARMVQTEKMASLGQMVAEVSHDLRNPVNFIHGNISYLTSYTEDLLRLVATYEAEVKQPSPNLINVLEEIDLTFLRQDLFKVIDSIKFGSEQLKRLVGGLQSFSNMNDTEASLLDVHECINSSLLILNSRTKDKVQIVRNFGDVPQILGFSGQLIQVFMNIIGNAIDALTERSFTDKMAALTSGIWQPSIAIATTRFETEANDRDRLSNHWVKIQISDNGPGIPKEIQDRIFETFFTTKTAGKGTGLGLAISHQIVTQKHGGKLSLKSPCLTQSDSQPAAGTEFTILLPVS